MVLLKSLNDWEEILPAPLAPGLDTPNRQKRDGQIVDDRSDRLP